MKLLSLTLIALTLSCSGRCSSELSHLTKTSVAQRSCFDPVDYGAVPSDGVDDRVGAQAALDAAAAFTESTHNPATVCFSPGRYTLSRAPLGSYDRYAALSTHGHDVTIRCDDAVLELVGDQGASGTILISIDPSAERIRVTGCVLDSSAAFNTAEQTHGVATSGNCSGDTCRPIRDVEVDHNRFVWIKRGSERKGDGVRLLGNAAPTAAVAAVAATTTTPAAAAVAATPGTELYGVRVHDNTGDCARSFAEIQRGVHHAIIANNTITCRTCDQDVDGEATGVIGEVGRPTDIVVANNTFDDGPLTQGDFAVSITSADRVVVAGNVMTRGIASYRSRDVIVTDNAISALNMKTERAVVEAVNACDGLVIEGNTIRRGGHLGPVIGLAPHSGTSCSGAVIRGNSITQGTPAWAVRLESASRVSVSGNRIEFTVPAPEFSAVYAHAVVADEMVTLLQISDNLVSGYVTYGVTLEGEPGSFGAGVSVTNNVATGTAFGLRCKGAPGFTSPVSIGGNTMGPSSYGTTIVSTGI